MELVVIFKILDYLLVALPATISAYAHIKGIRNELQERHDAGENITIDDIHALVDRWIERDANIQAEAERRREAAGNE